MLQCRILRKGDKNMGLNQVFKSGSTEKATEVSGNMQIVSSKKRSGPVLDNRETSELANLDLSSMDRDFNLNRNEATILSFENSEGSDYEDDSMLMDSVINTALKKHKKERMQNFIFDRIKAISSETKRINHNLDIGD